MRNAFLHDHGSYLHIVTGAWYFLKQIALILRPNLLVNGNFCVELNAECMILPEFEMLVLLSVTPFDANCETVALRKVVNVHDKKSKG